MTMLLLLEIFPGSETSVLIHRPNHVPLRFVAAEDPCAKGGVEVPTERLVGPIDSIHSVTDAPGHCLACPFGVVGRSPGSAGKSITGGQLIYSSVARSR